MIRLNLSPNRNTAGFTIDNFYNVAARPDFFFLLKDQSDSEIFLVTVHARVGKPMALLVTVGMTNHRHVH